MTEPLEHGSGASFDLSSPSSSAPLTASAASIPAAYPAASITTLMASPTSSFAGFMASTPVIWLASPPAPAYIPPCVTSPYRLVFDDIAKRVVPGYSQPPLDRLMFPVSSTAPNASSSTTGHIASGFATSLPASIPSAFSMVPTTLLSPLISSPPPFLAGHSVYTPLTSSASTGFSDGLAPSFSSATAPISAPAPFSTPLPWSLSSISPERFDMDLRALQDLLLRYFPQPIEPSPSFNIVSFLDQFFDLIRNTGDIPARVWIQFLFSPFTRL